MKYNSRRLVCLLPVRRIVFLMIFVIGALLTNSSVENISYWWSIMASCVNIATIFLLVLVARRNGETFKALVNYEKGKTKASQVVLISLLIVALGMCGVHLAGFICYSKFPYAAPMMIAPLAPCLAIANIFILPVTLALAEDGLYLGIGVNYIKNKYAAILLPAFFFALQHSFIPVIFDIRYIIYRFISFLTLTITLCWYYYKKRNPLPIMVDHAIIDVATVAQIDMTSLIPGLYDMMCSM